MRNFRLCGALTGLVLAIVATLGQPSRATIPMAAAGYAGRALSFYNDSADPEQHQVIAAAQKSHLAERMAALVNTNLYLRANLEVGFEACGKRANASFQGKRRAIVICTEFINLVETIAHRDQDFMMRLPKDQRSKMIDGLIWGVFFHELAHAVIHIDNVPITGREEDVADQFSAWFPINFIDTSRKSVIAPTIWFWSQLAMRRSLNSMSVEQRRRFMADEHSLDEQRIYNLACWYYGSGSEEGVEAARLAKLTSERAPRCAIEYAQLDQGMRSAFGKFFKTKPLRATR
jgi:hypothetical protein